MVFGGRERGGGGGGGVVDSRNRTWSPGMRSVSSFNVRGRLWLFRVGEG